MKGVVGVAIAMALGLDMVVSTAAAVPSLGDIRWTNCTIAPGLVLQQASVCSGLDSIASSFIRLLWGDQASVLLIESVKEHITRHVVRHRRSAMQYARPEFVPQAKGTVDLAFW